MKKYYAFIKMLEFMTENADVLDADMNNWCGEIEITGEDDVHMITITVKIENKEVNKDA